MPPHAAKVIDQNDIEQPEVRIPHQAPSVGSFGERYGAGDAVIDVARDEFPVGMDFERAVKRSALHGDGIAVALLV